VPTTIVTTTAPAVFTTTTIPSREAEFAGAPTSGYLPLEVTFTNVSAGDIKYCFWDFGDGSGISLDFSPIHNYRKPGKFTVTLVVVFSDGTKQEVVKQDYISVLVPCAFATSLHNQDDIELVRNLRDSYINNISWLDLFALYYKHTAEVTALLREHSELQHALIKQVTDNKQAIQELIMWRRTTLRMDALDEIAGFFLRLRDYGSTSLQDDIDLMLQGIEDRHLLHKLGVSVSY
jgi:PKD repeat protein